MASPDLLITPIADQLLQCLCDALVQVHEPAKVPQHCCKRVGELVSADASLYSDLCCEGLASLRVSDIFGTSDTFPEPDTLSVLTGCGAMAFGVTFTLSVLRCAPTGDISTIPACEEWTELFADVMNDAKAMRQAMTCCLFGQFDPGSIAVGSWTPLPTSGGCAGGEWPVTVQIIKTECCP